jgi:hypothetical protein
MILVGFLELGERERERERERILQKRIATVRTKKRGSPTC